MVLWVSWCSVQDGKQRVGEVQAAMFRVQQSFVLTLVHIYLGRQMQYNLGTLTVGQRVKFNWITEL
jgi:hypothetical protein